MKVLVACEFSGRVRDAFLERGHDALSVDILPTEAPGPHYEGDVFDVIHAGWDLMIAFPPCTHLSKAGARHWSDKRLHGWQAAGVSFVRRLAAADIPLVAIENPVGVLSTAWRKPDQIVQPHQFGDPYMKTTCLWLQGLPPLVSTGEVQPVSKWIAARSGDGGLHRDPHLRSLTFPGIARAMAEQWGSADSLQKEAA